MKISNVILSVAFGSTSSIASAFVIDGPSWRPVTCPAFHTDATTTTTTTTAMHLLQYQRKLPLLYEVLHVHEEQPVDGLHGDAIPAMAVGHVRGPSANTKYYDNEEDKEDKNKQQQIQEKSKYIIPLEQICLDDLPKVGG
jgi:hypothetical protein